MVTLTCSYIVSRNLKDCKDWTGLVSMDGATKIDWLNTTIGPDGDEYTIKTIQKDAYINALSAEVLCAHLKGIKEITDDNDWKKYSQPSDKNKIEELWGKYCDALNVALGKLTVTPKQKCINDTYGGVEADYKKDKKDCKDKGGKIWNDSSCSCENAKKSTSDNVLGCLDENAGKYYWCNIKGNDCSKGIPSHIKPGGCQYEVKIPLAYNYSFCNDAKGCNKINLKSGTHVTTSYKPEGLTSVYDGFKKLVEGLIGDGGLVAKVKDVTGQKVFLPIIGGPSFYGAPNKNDIKDLARALTLKTNETCRTHLTFPFNFVTMYGADGITPLGQFKIKVNPSKEVSCLYRIDGLVPWESSLTTKDRIISLLQNNPSPSQPIMVDLDKLSEYMVTIEFLNKLFKGWNIPTYVTAEGEVKYTGNGNDSKIIDKQKNDGEFNPSQYQRLYNSIEGLNNVLLEKPEGLITTLK